jgi:hypothetical protein
VKDLRKIIFIILINFIYFVPSGFAAERRIGIIFDTGVQYNLFNVYPPYSSATNNFNPGKAENPLFISRLGVFFQGQYTYIGLSFVFGHSEINRKDWEIEPVDHGGGVYTVRDYYKVYGNKKYVYGAEFDLRFFFKKMYYKGINFYALLGLGLFFEKNKLSKIEEIGVSNYATLPEYINHIEKHSNWYNKQRTGYVRKSFPYYGLIGTGFHYYFLHNFGLDFKISLTFENFYLGVMFRASIGFFFLVN